MLCLHQADVMISWQDAMLIPFTLCVKFASSTFMACICLNALTTIVYRDFGSDAFSPYRLLLVCTEV